MRRLISSVLIGSTLILTGCPGGGGGGGGGASVPSTSVDKVQAFVNLLNSKSNLESFHVVKDPSHSVTAGFVVVSGTGSAYLAYDIAKYNAGDSWSEYASRAEYGPVIIHGSKMDQASGETFFFGDAYTNESNPAYKGEFTFDESSENSKDLEKTASIKESFALANIAASLALEYGLSEERSSQVAKLALQWKKLSRTRALTEADANSFSKKLLGVSMNEASSAIEGYVLGDDSKWKTVVNTAAKVNQTSPEQMQEIIDGILK